ncbi:MAG: MFS transporter [Alphaproteobacteria bacterium]|nr:MFS transporter [Alphaproteobacteria bacterium]HJP20272.1 MFS transporter [Alphaproteobacteria bacterium]
MIARHTIVFLGTSQLICWGISFYLIGVFGELIVADLGWSRTLVYGGFSLALVVMGLVSPIVGRLIDRVGGSRVMSAGSVLCAAGCAGLAVAETLVAYYAAWICLGLAMRSTLYDAAFASLARIGGPEARRPIAQITLLGGLASTCFWPIGHLLAEAFGWRGALLVYAGFALLTLPLHLAIPGARHQDNASPEQTRRLPSLALRRHDRTIAALLYATIVTLTNGLNSGLSAHMIGVLTELGLGAGLAVSVSSLRGIGQSTARLAEILFGGRLHPVDLNLGATLVLPLCFTVGLASGGYMAAAVGFTLFYGAGIGILSITRGTLPLVLFDYRTYGAFVGKLLMPSFVLSAVSPLVFAAVIEHFGAPGALYLAIAMSSAILAAAIALKTLAARQDLST